MFHSDTHLNLAPPVGPGGKALPPMQPSSCITRTQILAALAVSLGSMIVGYSSAWSSPAIASMMEPGSGLELTEQVQKLNNQFKKVGSREWEKYSLR